MHRFLAILVGILPAALGQEEPIETPVLWLREVESLGMPVFGGSRAFVEVARGGTPLAIDLATGAHRWRGRGVPWAPDAVLRPLAWDGDRLFRLSPDGRLEVLDPATGSVRATLAEEGAAFLSTPTPAADVLLVPARAGEAGRIVAYDRGDLGRRWVLELEAPGRPLALGADGERFYRVAGDGVVSAFDLRDHRLLWSAPYGHVGSGRIHVLPPHAHGGRVVFAPPDGEALHCFDAATGAHAWSNRLPWDAIVAGAAEGRFGIGKAELSVRTVDGRYLGSIARPAGCGAIDGRVAVVAARREDGSLELVALDLATGRESGVPIDLAGDVFAWRGVALVRGDRALLACSIGSLLAAAERRASWRAEMDAARRDSDPERFARARILATSIRELVEADLGRAEAFLRRGRTEDSLAAFLDLLADHGSRSSRESLRPAEFRFGILFDCAGPDREAVDRWLEPYLRRAREGSLGEEDRRRLRSLPEALVPPELAPAAGR